MEVFFESEEGERDADAVWADALLDDGGEAALEVDGERDEWQHHEEREEHDLDGNDEQVEEEFRHGETEVGKG